MSSELIKKHLEELKSQKKFDVDFVDILANANETDQDGGIIADKIMKAIKKRYAEGKEDKT